MGTKINSNINDRFDKNTIKKGLKYFANGQWASYGVIPSGYTEIGSNNTGVTETTLSVLRWGAICIINFYGTIKNAADTRYKLYTLPNNLWAAGLTPCLGSDGSSKASMMALGSDIAFDFMTTISNYTMRSALTAIITSDPTDY